MDGLSIVIPSYKRPDLLAACLESVLQHRPDDCEVIVVDDASAHQAISNTAHTFPEVRVLRLAEQQGFCGAVNAGIQLATQPIVELLNDDTEVCAGWAQAALERFVDPQVAAVAPLVLYWPDGARIDSAGDGYFMGGVAWKRGHGEPLTAKHLHARTVAGASASSAFYRRQVLLDVGGFPADFGAYFEDVDLSCRLRRAGYRIVFEPNARVLHHVSASHGRRPDPLLLRQQSRNEERVFWRNLTMSDCALGVPLHLGVLLAKLWKRYRDGGLPAFLAGRWDAWNEMTGSARSHEQRPGSATYGNQ